MTLYVTFEGVGVVIEDGVPLEKPAGTVISLPDDEATSLIERGFAYRAAAPVPEKAAETPVT